MFAHLLFCLALGPLPAAPAFADDAVIEAGTDVEEISADSEAAIRLAKEAKLQAAKEREENAAALKQAAKLRELALAKRHEAQREIKMREAELAQLKAERERVRADIAKYEREVATAEKIITDSRAEVEKSRAELETLRDSRKEAQDRLTELLREREAVVKEKSVLESQREAAGIAAGTEPSPSAARPGERAPVAATAEQTPAKAEVEAAEVPTTLRIDCRVHDGPNRNSPVIGVQRGGSSIPAGVLNKGWIEFSYNAQKGYIAKSCF